MKLGCKSVKNNFKVLSVTHQIGRKKDLRFERLVRS